jgi:hypothetical protein
MLRECGDKNFPIWLLGDSEPENWSSVLNTPLDPRHPIRHNIWTSVLDVIQDKVYRDIRNRLDTSTLYIRNAVGDKNTKPGASEDNWSVTANNELEIYKNLINEHNPMIILSFGAFAFEFARRSLGENHRKYGYWDTKKLGDEFCSRVDKFDCNKTNIIPMLHRSIAGGKFMVSHEYFCKQQRANYFDFTGNKIAELIIKNKESLKVFIG